MSILDQTYLSKIKEGTREEALQAAKDAGKEYEPLWFDYREQNWDTALYYLQFLPGENGPYPEINLENWFPDFSDIQEEIQAAGRENPIFAAPKKDEEDPLEEIEEAFETACMIHFDAEKPVKNLLKNIQSTLQIFIPLLPNEETIPQQRYSGCDTESPQWKSVVNWALQNVTDWKQDNPPKLLQELAENATYGGQPGLIVPLDGKDVVLWIESKNLHELITSQGEGCKTSLAIYDFINGSGYDLDTITVNWKNVPKVEGSQPGIINNFIEDVFGIVGNTPITIPNKGRSYSDNIWLPTK